MCFKASLVLAHALLLLHVRFSGLGIFLWAFWVVRSQLSGLRVNPPSNELAYALTLFRFTPGESGVLKTLHLVGKTQLSRQRLRP